MYYAIIPLIATMLLASSFMHAPPEFAALVSFAKGKYDPSLIDAAGGRVVQEFSDMGMLLAIVRPATLSSLEQSPAVEFVESDRQFEIADTSEYSESWALRDIGVEPAHSKEYTGKGIKVALLDTGIDYTHHELEPSYRGGYDFVNDDSDPMDDNGHGTHVAGILAAARDGKGVVGVAPDAEIYAIKVSDAKGKGSFSGLVKGINWSIENGMDVVSMSITGQGGSRALAKAVDIAYNKHGLVMVAAVGNGGKGDVLYPAAYENVIGVGSVTEDNTKSSFSRIGSEVELVAPGSGIKSTAIGEKYRLSSGTSMATPYVTGAIALLLGSDERAWNKAAMANGDGKWTNDEIRQVLRETAIDLGEDGKDDSFGYGLLNLDLGSVPEIAIAPPEKEPAKDKPVVIKLNWFAFRIEAQPIS